MPYGDTGRLAAVAPRLARAIVLWHEHERLRARRANAARGDVLRLERLVAHRELQLLRAQAGLRGQRRAAVRGTRVRARQGNGAYMDTRAAALGQASEALERARRRLVVVLTTDDLRSTF